METILTDYIVIAVLSLLGVAFVAGVGFLIWCRQTLLKNVATVDVDDVDPVLLRKIESLQLEYDVAVELGYPGEVLVHLEAKLNAAKLAAGNDPNAVNVTLVVAPAVCPNQVGVFTSAVMGVLSNQPAWTDVIVPRPSPIPNLRSEG